MQEHAQPTVIDLGTDAVERMVRMDLDPQARVRSVVLLCRPGPNIVLRVHLEEGGILVCKVRGGEGLDVFEREAYQLSYLAGQPGLSVPKVLAHRRDGAAGPFTYMLLSCLPGIPWSRFQSHTPRQEKLPQRQLGDMLGRMHAEMTALQFSEVLPGPSPRFPSWTRLFAHLWEKRLEEVVCSDRLDALTLDAVEWIHRNLSSLIEADDGPRLIHGNLSGDSILLRESDGTWAVSGFLDPALCYGHCEVDLALLDLHCQIDERFFESYTQHLPVDEGYAIRKYVYMLYFVLDSVRLYGNTHDILSAVDCSRAVLQRCGS